MIVFNRAALMRAYTGFSVLFLGALAVATPKWERLAKKIASKDWEEDLVLPEGSGELYDRDGGAPKRVAIQRTYTVTNEDKVNWMEIPRRAIEFDKLGAWDTQVQIMGRNAASYGDQAVHGLMVDGFTALGPDGVAFFSASHPIDGGVQANLQAGALSASTYEAALTKLQSMTDFYGRPLAIGFDSEKKPVLIVGPSLRSTANSIVGVSNDAAGAGNPNFDTAVVRVDPRLIGSYAGYWFLAWEDDLVKPFAITVAKEPELHMVTDPEDKDVRDRNVVPAWVEAVYGAGYAWYHVIIGSTGT